MFGHSRLVVRFDNNKNMCVRETSFLKFNYMYDTLTFPKMLFFLRS